jgi:FdhE protein
MKKPGSYKRPGFFVFSVLVHQSLDTLKKGYRIMQSIINEIETLKEDMKQVLAERPHVGGLLNAFGPLLLAKGRWLGGIRTYKRTFPVDPIQYLEGKPLIQQCQLILPEDLWGNPGLSIIEAIGQGFPQLAEDMANLAKLVADGKFDCFCLIHSSSASNDDGLTVQAKNLEVADVSLQFLQRFLTRFILAKRAQDMAPELAPLPWKKGYCPVCGSFPQLAIIRDKGLKWLQCSSCSHEWQFPRLTCPYCDHEDPKDTNYLFVEGKKEETAFICKKCRKYLITTNRSETLRQANADIIAISLAHLDIILQGKGFQPMVNCEWNTFHADQEDEG